MRRVTIAVIGNAKTTRANVEALISDVVDSVDEATIALVYDKNPADGVTWAEQWAIDKELPLTKYPNNNYDALFSEHNLDEIKFFMLWGDEDPECQLAASKAQESRILAYDLTDGLILIPLNSEPIVRPVKSVMPIVETKVTEDLFPVEEKLSAIEEILSEEEEEEPDDDYDSEYDLEKNLVVLVSEMGKIFAQSFAKEFKRIIEE